jgi:REP element-mobilizing transposase RayT
MFRDEADREFFTDLIAARVGRSKFRPRAHRKAGRFPGVEVAAVCLMTTHFHLVIWQLEADAVRRFMQSLLTSYVRYYNRKYNAGGALFDGPFRSRPLNTNKQIRWAVAYVNANHPSGPDYRYSTHCAFIDEHVQPGWLKPERALMVFGGREQYATYMRDHATRAELNARFF